MIFYQRAFEALTVVKNRHGEHIVAPDTSGTVHAAAVRRKPRLKPFFNTYGGRAVGWKALCGARVKAITAATFTEEGTGLCPKCVERIRVIEYTGEDTQGHITVV